MESASHLHLQHQVMKHFQAARKRKLIEARRNNHFYAISSGDSGPSNLYWSPLTCHSALTRASLALSIFLISKEDKVKTSKHYFIIFICGRGTLPLPIPPQARPQKTTFSCSRNVGELNYSWCMVQGVTATQQEGNLSLHFKCDSSLHRCLLSSLFLFNNLITSLDLIFFPQMSLQRFMPMNIHPLLKNRVPFSQGRCSSAAGLGGLHASLTGPQ